MCLDEKQFTAAMEHIVTALKEKGYETAAFHGAENMDFWNRRTVYPNLGFNRFFGGIVGSETCEDGLYEPNDNMSFL